MKNYFKELLKNNKEIVMYLIFGVLTTLVNIIVYYIFNDLLHVHYMISNGIAWFLSVVFAYITNRKFVFSSGFNSIATEFSRFIGTRLSTGLMDMVIMWLLIDILHVNSFFSKIFSNILVVISNYILSKLFVFKGGKADGKD